MDNLKFLVKEFSERLDYLSYLVEKNKDVKYSVLDYQMGYEAGEFAFAKYALSLINTMISMEAEND